METAALLATAALQIVENWSLIFVLSPAIAWSVVWGDAE